MKTIAIFLIRFYQICISPSSRASLQVLSYVLPICAGSGEKVWFSERNLSGYEKITEMSSLP